MCNLLDGAVLVNQLGISDAFRLGREQNKAITRVQWNGERFIYHGMNNMIYLGNVEDLGCHYVPCAADLVATDWVIMPDWPYHGWLERWNQN
jgi:hypothetical protein